MHPCLVLACWVYSMSSLITVCVCVCVCVCVHALSPRALWKFFCVLSLHHVTFPYTNPNQHHQQQHHHHHHHRTHYLVTDLKDTDLRRLIEEVLDCLLYMLHTHTHTHTRTHTHTHTTHTHTRARTHTHTHTHAHTQRPCHVTQLRVCVS